MIKYNLVQVEVFTTIKLGHLRKNGMVIFGYAVIQNWQKNKVLKYIKMM